MLESLTTVCGEVESFTWQDAIVGGIRFRACTDDAGRHLVYKGNLVYSTFRASAAIPVQNYNLGSAFKHVVLHTGMYLVPHLLESWLTCQAQLNNQWRAFLLSGSGCRIYAASYLIHHSFLLDSWGFNVEGRRT